MRALVEEGVLDGEWMVAGLAGLGICLTAIGAGRAQSRDVWWPGYGNGPDNSRTSPRVRSYDVLTRKLVWTFHTVPRPGEFGYDTWPKDAWRYVGGTNNWGEMTIDTARGVAYVPLGSPTYDFYGADRTGINLFGSSIVALDTARADCRIRIGLDAA
jgi:hypothetical protein